MLVAIGACALDRGGRGQPRDLDGSVRPADTGPPGTLDAGRPDERDAGPPRDGGPTDSYVPPRDAGCTPRCVDDVLHSCARGRPTIDCGAMDMRCDDALDMCAPEACTPGSTCSADGASVVTCADGESTVMACARGCTAGACRPEVACDSASYTPDGTIGLGTTVVALCGGRDDHDHSTTSGSSCPIAADGEDRLYRLPVPRAARYEIEVNDRTGGANVDPIVYIRRVCSDRASELVCDDDAGPGYDSRASVMLEPGEYFLVIDSNDYMGGGSNCGDVDVIVRIL